jgi:hypothetical protein
MGTCGVWVREILWIVRTHLYPRAHLILSITFYLFGTLSSSDAVSSNVLRGEETTITFVCV